jgi:hypothetical protein
MRTVTAAEVKDDLALLRSPMIDAFVRYASLKGVVLQKGVSGWQSVLVIQKPERTRNDDRDIHTGRYLLSQIALDGAPFATKHQALRRTRNAIAEIKGMRRHPLVKCHINPEYHRWLKVRHESFGFRWSLLDKAYIKRAAKRFSEATKRNFGDGVDCLSHARRVVADLAPQFAYHRSFVLAPRLNDDSFKLGNNELYPAIAFLLANRIDYLDACAEMARDPVLPLPKPTRTWMR